MSPREKAQNDLVKYLENKCTSKGKFYFDAPYGILDGMEAFGTGKVRTIAFGVSRYLDCKLTIISPTEITVDCRGGLDYKFEGTYSSVEDLISHFDSEIH